MQIDTNNSTLFYLLRVAIGTERVEVPKKVEGVVWQSVYALARKQGVLAVAFDGLSQLFEADKEFAQSFPLSLKLQWINAVFNIESRYDYSRNVCADIVEKWVEQGVKTLCLKGLAFSTYYPVPNHRECGDFDCYLYDDYKKGNDIARALGAKVDDGWYKHSEICYRKVMIENHQFIVAIRNGKMYRLLHNLLDEIARTEPRTPLFDTKIEMPSAMFNALFLNHHSLIHFLSEGIHLRHILDWALFLKAEQENLDWERFYALCEKYEMRAFVDCSTALAVEIFGIEIKSPMVVAHSPYTERVLSSVLNDNNSVFSQNVGAWTKRKMLIKNLFASRWKYESFSNQGILSKFITLVWGYLTHPEED
ncbi:MAG: nucleotidyltransferase family protein [Alistipes sp.]|nr:nucleotidyltransferase family protein [Alistipes sp.]